MPFDQKLKILFVSAEVAPFAKTGGLADVCGSLPGYLVAAGHDARIVMPKYRTIDCQMDYIADFPIHINARKQTCIIKKLTHGNVYFVENEHYYERYGIYGHHDDAERFAFFCRAAVEMLPYIEFQPDIIHLNDWHTGPISMILKEHYEDHPFFKNIASIFTIHNLKYQGNFHKDTLRFFNVGDYVFVPEKVEFFNSFSFIKAGICYSDIINTVSETYAKEILTSNGGEGLDGFLIRRSADLYGITNGIDYEVFNPETDTDIYKNYNAQSLDDKKLNKFRLQKDLGLPEADIPMIALISRLTDQKGLELVLDTLGELMKQNLQFVLLGTGDEYYENAFRMLHSRYKEKFGLFIGFNPVLAQRIYAGSDIFLMPSVFEPCGLGQLISLRYGTIPVVRSTGGLKDTIKDYSENPDQGNGFTFDEFSSCAMLGSIMKALDIFNTQPEKWSALVERSIKQDYSWGKSVEKYLCLYKKAINNLRANG